MGTADRVRRLQGIARIWTNQCLFPKTPPSMKRRSHHGKPRRNRILRHHPRQSQRIHQSWDNANQATPLQAVNTRLYLLSSKLNEPKPPPSAAAGALSLKNQQHSARTPSPAAPRTAASDQTPTRGTPSRNKSPNTPTKTSTTTNPLNNPSNPHSRLNPNNPHFRRTPRPKSAAAVTPTAARNPAGASTAASRSAHVYRLTPRADTSRPRPRPSRELAAGTVADRVVAIAARVVGRSRDRRVDRIWS